ncbi:MAG TPA: hypothetical protein VER04_30010 [Polyangiaceae bacterium]|nr:hypothetical protein [Polyangiaceae bacterium]
MRARSFFAWGLVVFSAAGCSGRAVDRADSKAIGGAGQGSVVGTLNGGGGSGPDVGGTAGRPSEVEVEVEVGGAADGDELGAGASDGDAGSPGVPRCVPGQTIACACATGQPGAQTCTDDGRYGSCVCHEGTLAWFRTKLTGQWTGTRTMPWDDPMAGPTTVKLEFKADGTWLGTCDRDDCLVFDFGSLETSLNRYHLTDANDDRVAFGRLSVTWTGGYSTEGELREIRFASNETELSFEFWATWNGAGPISFALHRSP